MSIEATLERVSAIRQALADPAAMIGSAGNLTGGTEAPTATTATGAGASSFASALEQANASYASPSEEGFATTAGALADSGVSTSALLDGSSATGLSATVPGTAQSVSPSYSSLSNASGVVGSSGLSPVYTEDQDSPGARIVAIAESQLGQTEEPPGSNESPAIAEYRTATAGAIPGAPWCAYFASWVARQAGEPIGEAGQGAGAVSEVWSWAQSTGRAIPNGPGVVPQPGDLIVFGDEHVGIVRDVLPNGQIQTIEGNYENKVAANVR
ncbi:MAG: CHAP domain-containing protein, partial [Solirubrobacteraceae bacterium]